jgi:hypothetical protein
MELRRGGRARRHLGGEELDEAPCVRACRVMPRDRGVETP